MSGATVEIAARTFAIPFECPCCGALPDGEITVALPRAGAGRAGDDAARSLVFPYCRACLAHATAWTDASTTASGVMLVGIVAGVIVAVAARVAIGLAVVGCTIPIATVAGAARRGRARARCGPACASVGPAVAYLTGTGTTRVFAFASPTYTARFAEQNAGRLTNVGPPLRALLDGHRVARLVVPTPAAAVTVVSPPPSVAQWIEKLEAAPGRIARRNTLARALEVAHAPPDRHRVLAAACQLELADVLDQLDDRSSVAARKLQLEAAISEVRADNLHDELREAMLRELESCVRALG